MVPGPGPHHQMFRNSVIISSSRGTLALGDGFIKTKATGDLLSFKQANKKAFFGSSILVVVQIPYGDLSFRLLFISKRNFEQASLYIYNVYSKLDIYCCTNMLWIL